MKIKVWIPVLLIGIIIFAGVSRLQTQENIEADFIIIEQIDTPDPIESYNFIGSGSTIGRVSSVMFPLVQSDQEGEKMGYMEVVCITPMTPGLWTRDKPKKIVILDEENTPIPCPVKEGENWFVNKIHSKLNSIWMSVSGRRYNYTGWDGESYIILEDTKIGGYSVEADPKPLENDQVNIRLDYNNWNNSINIEIRNESEDYLYIESPVEVLILNEREGWAPVSYKIRDISVPSLKSQNFTGTYFTAQIFPGVEYKQRVYLTDQKPGIYKVSKSVFHRDSPGITLERKLTIPGYFPPVLNLEKQYPFNLFPVLAKNQSNIVFSPYSASTVFSMVYEGAKGGTAEEIQQVFDLEEDDTLRHGLIENYEKGGPITINSVNGMWLSNGISFHEDYLETVGEFYGANLTNIDFSDSEAARVRINGWVSNKTREKIPELFPPESINPHTTQVVCNALYFTGNWLNQFDPENTEPRPFIVSDNETVMVDTMYYDAEDTVFRYYNTRDLEIVELPYVDETTSMYILMPFSNSTHLFESLTSKQFVDLEGEMDVDYFDLYLPKFKLESSLKLKKPLGVLNLSTCFTPEADYSGISDAQMWTEEVYHQATVEVTEVGTEAFAASGLYNIIGMKSEVRIDHPFLFFIIDKKTDTILFMGKVTDPSLLG